MKTPFNSLSLAIALALTVTSLTANAVYVPDLSAPLPTSPDPKAVDCSPSTTAKTWEVGPGLAYETIGDVDWNHLKAGDVVRIHWRATPYAEKILLSTSGTVANPIKVCGVPGGPTADSNMLPTITGENAKARADLAYRNDVPENYDTDGVLDSEHWGLILVFNKTFEKKPKNIIIEGLHLTGANQFTSFTATNGKTGKHNGFTACIFVQEGDNISIRGNEIENCGHGVFANSHEYESQATRNLLIESNYVHGNGALDLPDLTGVRSQSVHSMYIQSIGMTLQFNYFGPNRNKSQGGIFKDRSVGSVVRYNWFSQGARILDFVEPQSANTLFIPAAWDQYLADVGNTNGLPSRANVVKANKQFQKTYVYGNFIRNDLGNGTIGKGAYAPVHFGGDEGGETNNRVRQGKLYLFNNTVLTYASNQAFARTNVFDMGLGSPLTTPGTKIEAFNNIIHLQSRTATAPRPDYYLARHDYENINFGKNWVTSDTQAHGFDAAEVAGLAGTGVINGLANLTGGMAAPINLNSLKSVNVNMALKNAGQALPAEIAGLTLKYQLLVNRTNPLLSKPVLRSSTNALDLGAYAIAP